MNPTAPLISEMTGPTRPNVEDAVIKEARRRARRRRIRQGLVVAVIVAAVVAALGSRQSPPPQSHGSPAAPQDSGLGLTDVSDPAQLMAKYGRVHVGWVLVYVDGRVLWYPDHDPVFERRLTPSGVALVRAGSLEELEDLLDAKGSTFPAGTWIERKAREYRPDAYAVCLWAASNQPGEAGALPAAARNVLSEAPPARAGHVVAASHEASAWHCLRIGRTGLAILERTAKRVNRWESGDEIVFARSTDGSTVTASVSPMMPHGEWIAWGG